MPKSKLQPTSLLGKCRCPECGYPDAEIRADKNGHPYRYCEDCEAKYLTFGRPVQVKNLLKKILPVGVPAHA